MSEYGIGSLQEIANAILKALQANTDKVVGILENIRKLPDQVAKLGEQVTAAANSQIQAQGDFEISLRMANSSSRRTLVEEEALAIEEFKKQLSADVEEIDQRYGKIQKELDEEAHKRVREIDMNALSLYSDHFPMRLYEQFTENTEPVLNIMLQDSVKAFGARTVAIDERVHRLEASLDKFITERSSFFSNVHAFTYDKSDAALGEYTVPVWVIETERVPDHYSKRVAVLSGGSADHTALCDEELKPINDQLQSDSGTSLVSKLKWGDDSGYRERLLEALNNSTSSEIPDADLKLIAKALRKSETKTIVGVQNGEK